MKKASVFSVLVLSCLFSEAQTLTRYLIRFRNKAGTPFTLSAPSQYLSQRALDRRTRYAIPVDSTDLPITPRYIDSVRLAGTVTVLNGSRWLNQISIQTTDAAALAKIAAFPFVAAAQPIASRIAGRSAMQASRIEPRTSNPEPPPSPRLWRASGTTNREQRTTADFFNYGQSYNQVHIHNGEFLHNIGLRGQGMVFGIFDGGFRNYTTLRAFDSVNGGGQVLSTYDFVARETSVTEDDPHGMQCFSVIAANVPGTLVGTAPKASFHLFRSEDGASEYPVEEHNWVCAAERLDSAGGDLISSSVAYSIDMTDPAFNHAYAEMDGNTTIAARGADLAAKKGILVVNSAGNDGNNASYKYISSPADGDSVMAVGAVNASGAVASFSSYGPSADGQVKPDVASVGVSTFLWTTANTVGTNNGTSFACPNIAGLAACLWQGFPEVTNARILNALRQAGSKAASPDDRVGFGIPDLKKAVMALLKEFSTATVAASSCRNTVTWTSKGVGTMKFEVERRAPGETAFTRVGERPATGSLFGVQSHQFTDTLVNVQAGTVTYRIRQTIDTAAATFSADYIDTVSVNLASSCVTTNVGTVPANGEEVVLLPNPVRGSFTVKVTTPYPVQHLLLRIVNAKGQVVRTEPRNKPSGTSRFDFDAGHLARGKYLVSVYNGERLMATKELLKL